MATILNRDPAMLVRMEQDLIAKASATKSAYPGIDINIYGVFDLEDLSRLQESDLSNGIGVGVGYLGLDPFVPAPGTANAARAPAVKMMVFSFILLLAVPATDGDANRFNAATYLSMLRAQILGTTIDGDTTQKTWNLYREKPEIGESTRTMLYYSQVWQVT